MSSFTVFHRLCSMVWFCKVPPDEGQIVRAATLMQMKREVLTATNDLLLVVKTSLDSRQKERSVDTNISRKF